MRKTIAAAILAGSAILGAIPAASASARPATPAQQACAAFRAWDQHRTAARLTALVVDSTRLGRSYLRADIGQLYADASSPSPKAAKYLGDDATYVNQDCGG